jgi:hypothetical protein
MGMVVGSGMIALEFPLMGVCVGGSRYAEKFMLYPSQGLLMFHAFDASIDRAIRPTNITQINYIF